MHLSSISRFSVSPILCLNETSEWGSLYLPENNRGPDDAEHDWHGVFLIHDVEGKIEKSFKGEIRIEDVYQKSSEITYS